MRQQLCQQCQQEFPLNDLYQVRDRVLCAPCGDRYLKEPGVKVLKSEIHRLSDPTVCTICKKESGGPELGRLGKMPTCDECATKLRSRPFPLWLRASTAGLLVLLVISLIHCAGYLQAATAFVRGQRLMDAGQYEQADAQLAQVLAIAPDCKTALLLKIKADLLTDNFAAVGDLVKRTEGMQFQGDLITEINGLLQRSGDALKANQQAAALSKDGRDGEALPLAKKAHDLFPESHVLNINYLGVLAGVDFDRKDYDGFLQQTEAMVKLMPASAATQSMLASAFATKYASTGDENFHQQALAVLASAKALAHTAEEKAAYTEYSERILYRLNTRDIIDKKEYDRRFRSGSPPS